MSPLDARLGAVLALVALAGSPDPANAHMALVGGFRPVAAETSARALWVNPAIVGVSGQGSAVAELFLDDAGSVPSLGEDVEWGIPDRIRGLALAASTDKLAYGFQKDFDDVPGVPDWSLSVGNRTPMGRRGQAGATMEWRGGKELEATAGLLLPAGRNLYLAAVARDILEREVDGVPVSRSWQLGAGLPLRSLLGRVTWDTILTDGNDPVHWLGFAVDRSRYAHLALARSSEGDWSATFDLVFSHHMLGVGAVARQDALRRPESAHLSAEWHGQEIRGSGRPRRR